MDISALCNKLSITSPAVISRSSEYARLLRVRISNCTTGHHVACIELASKSLKYTGFDTTIAYRYSACNTLNQYKSTVKSVTTLLQLESTVSTVLTLNKLSLIYSLTHLNSQYNEYYQLFIQLYNQSLPILQRINQQSYYTNPILLSVLFYLVSKKFHSRIEKNKLKKRFEINDREWNKTMEKIITLIPALKLEPMVRKIKNNNNNDSNHSNTSSNNNSNSKRARKLEFDESNTADNNDNNSDGDVDADADADDNDRFLPITAESDSIAALDPSLIDDFQAARSILAANKARINQSTAAAITVINPTEFSSPRKSPRKRRLIIDNNDNDSNNDY